MHRIENTYQKFLLRNSSAIFRTRFNVQTADLNKQMIRSLLDRDKGMATKTLDEIHHYIIGSFGTTASLNDIKMYWLGLVSFVYHSHSLSVNYIDSFMMAKSSALMHTIQTYDSVTYLTSAVPWFIDRLFELEHSLHNDSNLILAIDYINEHVTDELDIFTVASHVKVSPKSLNSAFREKLGVSFKDYVREKRLYRSCQDLTFTALTIKEIATKYRYEHQSHYSTHFKELFGVTPLQYRKSINTTDY